jgi:hypothetical protein
MATREIRRGKMVLSGHWRDQVRGRHYTMATGDQKRQDGKEWSLERPGEGKIVQNGHWRDQKRQDGTEWSMERPGEGRQYRMAIGDTR